MASLEEQVLESLTSITKDKTIQLDADVTKTKKTPLTFEQMKEILETGGSIPEGSSLPTSLTQQQYSQLPGGLSAYQNLQGMGMMDAIKGTAGFGKGPGGTTPEQEGGDEDDSNEIIVHNCPSGFVFDTVKKMCVPIQNNDRERDAMETAEQLAMTKRSYQSFADMISNSDEYKKGDGTWNSFKKNMSNSWMGSAADFLFNDTDMLYSSWANTYGTNLNLLEQKQKGVPAYTTTTAPTFSSQTMQMDQNELTSDTTQGGLPTQVGEPVGAGQAGDPGYSTPFTDATTIQSSENVGPEDVGEPTTTFDSSFNKKPDSSTEYTSIQESVPQYDNNKDDEKKENRDGTSFKDVNPDTKQGSDGGGSLGGGDYGGIFNKGGFVEQAKPIQLDDVSLKMQEGGQVPVAPPVEGMPMPSGQPAGFIEDPSAAPAPDTPIDAMQGQGQKDDVIGELPEGTFVINAMAVQLAGIEELDTMVEKAYEDLSENMRKKGVDENLVTQLVGSSRSQAGMKEQMVDVAVSNGEYIVPPEIVPIIGEDKLRKINDRGLRKLEEEKKTKEKQPEAPMMMDKGGFVIATDPDGKILTEKVKDESGREVSRILSRDEVGSAEERSTQQGPRDGGSYQDVSTKDIDKSKSFVRRKGVDEYIEKDPRDMKMQGFSTPGVGGDPRQMDTQGFSVTTPKYTEDTYETRNDAIVNFDAGKGGDPDPDRFVDLTKGIGEGQRRTAKKPTFTVDQLNEIASQYEGSIDPRRMDTQGFSVPSPLGKDISLIDQLKIINQAYKNNSIDLLSRIADGQPEDTTINYSDDARERAKQLYIDLSTGKKYSDKTQTEIEIDSKIENKILNNAQDSRFNQFKRSTFLQSLSNQPIKDAVQDSRFDQFKRSTYLQGLNSKVDNQAIGVDFDPNTGEYYKRGQGPRDDGSYQSFMNASLADGNVQTIENMEEFSPPVNNTVDENQIKDFMEKRIQNKNNNKFNVKAKKISTLDPDNPIYIFNGNLSKNQVISINPDDYEKTIPIRLRFALEMMNAESMGKIDAKSFTDAEGIFQLRRSIFGPAANEDAPGFNVKSATSETEYQDPEWQFNTAMDYVDAMLEKYNGNLEKAALAYNVGFAYVDKLDELNYDELEMIIREGIPELGVKPRSYEVANRMVRYARQYIDKIFKEGALRNPPPLPPQKGFTTDITPPLPKPKQTRMGGFV